MHRKNKNFPSLFVHYDPAKFPFRQLFALDDPRVQLMQLQLARHHKKNGPEDPYSTTCSEEVMKMINDKTAFNAFLVQAGFGKYVPKMYNTRFKVSTRMSTIVCAIGVFSILKGCR
jgi:hypothetical protein